MSALASIQTVDDLRRFLAVALQLEHATLPPYLTALYSIPERTNDEAQAVLRIIAHEEMLHMTQVANLLNAIGTQPDVTRPDFVASYPCKLPDGETQFDVHIQRFCKEALDEFLKIEQPKRPASGADLAKADRSGNSLLRVAGSEPVATLTIGDFYDEIARGFQKLHDQDGASLFCGQPDFQVRPEHVFNVGGKLRVVTDLPSALAAIQFIDEQGEGYDGKTVDQDNELAHYFRFQQLQASRKYQGGDPAGAPSGDPITVDYSVVYPIISDPVYADYPEGSDLRRYVADFAAYYQEFLGRIQVAFSGQPERIAETQAAMGEIRDRMRQIIREPIPGREDVNATPIFRPPP